MTSRDIIPGVIQSVTDTVIVIVSFTGNRVHVPTSRLHPAWTYSAPAPASTIDCEVVGCRAPVVMVSATPGSPFAVCPQHMPVGVQGRLLTPEDNPTSTLGRTIPLCPFCSASRLQERPGVTLRTADPAGTPVFFYECMACNAAMFYMDFTLVDLKRWFEDFLLDSGGAIGDVIEIRFGREAYASILEPFESVMDVIAPLTTAQEGKALLFSWQVSSDGALEGRDAFFRVHRLAMLSKLRPSAPVKTGDLPPVLIPPAEDSTWVNKRSGDVVHVLSSKDCVTFKGVTQDSPSTLTLKDFYDFHRQVTRPRKGETQTIQVRDEFIGPRGITLFVEEIHPDLGVVRVMQDGASRTVRLAELNDGRWSKVVRRSAYDRLLDD